MKRELIFTFCCLLTTLVWSQEYQRTETGIKASIFGKKIDVEVQWFNANSPVSYTHLTLPTNSLV